MSGGGKRRFPFSNGPIVDRLRAGFSHARSLISDPAAFQHLQGPEGTGVGGLHIQPRRAHTERPPRGRRSAPRLGQEARITLNMELPRLKISPTMFGRSPLWKQFGCPLKDDVDLIESGFLRSPLRGKTQG
jgi:hypothetical protein